MWETAEIVRMPNRCMAALNPALFPRAMEWCSACRTIDSRSSLRYLRA